MVSFFLALCLGVGLAAACGLRVFLPLLALSLASKAGLVDVGSGFAWLGSWTAIACFSLAALTETLAYYIPWLDHALDTIATPAAAIAGTLVAATQLGLDAHAVDPMLKWSASLIAGGGAATAVQSTTVLARAVSTASTAGLGNSIVATVENVGAIVLSILSLVVPLLVGVLLLALVFALLHRVITRRRAALAPAIA